MPRMAGWAGFRKVTVKTAPQQFRAVPGRKGGNCIARPRLERGRPKLVIGTCIGHYNLAAILLTDHSVAGRRFARAGSQVRIRIIVHSAAGKLRPARSLFFRRRTGPSPTGFYATLSKTPTVPACQTAETSSPSTKPSSARSTCRKCCLASADPKNYSSGRGEASPPLARSLFVRRRTGASPTSFGRTVSQRKFTPPFGAAPAPDFPGGGNFRRGEHFRRDKTEEDS